MQLKELIIILTQVLKYILKITKIIVLFFKKKIIQIKFFYQ